MSSPNAILSNVGISAAIWIYGIMRQQEKQVMTQKEKQKKLFVRRFKQVKRGLY
jgi:hypothetical protein